MKNIFVKFIKSTSVILYAILSATVVLFAGCSSMMLTRTPPLTKELGYKVPNYKNWTTTGLNAGVYRFEVEKLKTWKVMIGMVNDPALALHEKGVNLLGAASTAGLLGGGPLLLRMLPKGAVKKEEHERLVAEAGMKDPEEFKKQMT